MEKFIPFKRLRKVSPNPKAYLRLHRGEFGHNFGNQFCHSFDDHFCYHFDNHFGDLQSP